MSLESELQSVQRALQQGDLHEAAELLRRASANHPNDFDVWLSLASAERRLGRPEAAREACQRSIRIAQSAAAYSLLSQCESDLGDLAAAKEAGRRAVNMDSTAVSSRVFLAHLLLKTGHREEAVREFRTAAKFDGNRVRALTSLAHASLIEGNPEESLGFALEAQRVAPA
ncbi:MAG TPA: tetratricopeptide repeat protein, partial [Fimbriimonas sp.]|nr:tetratricopeptide repeat protein [Fimbriimonas sp.]